MILYGPPGTGKTTIARIVATRRRRRLRGGVGGQRRPRRGPGGARPRRASAARGGRPTVFFLDEIHRFNKAQQDALLPAVEDGPGHADRRDHREPLLRGQLGAALALLRSTSCARSAAEQVERAAAPRARATPSAGSPSRPRSTTTRSRCSPRAPAATPARRSARSSGRSSRGRAGAARSTSATAEDALQRKAVHYDREGDQHYDYISAWIKATRGSDVDASLYYLAAMLEGGEDPRFIARRMVILASEDIGNADPQALVVATAAGAAVDRVGLPECRLNLAQAAVYLALAPKSNASYAALSARRGARPRARRRRAARRTCATPTTRAPRSSAAASATATRTTSPAASPTSRSLPEALAGERFYEPTDRGFEAELAERLERLGSGLPDWCIDQTLSSCHATGDYSLRRSDCSRPCRRRLRALLSL